MHLAENSTVRRRTFVLLFLPLLLAAIVSVGCVAAPTLYPLYDKSVAATDDTIVGRWDGVDQPDASQKLTDKQKKAGNKNNCCWTIQKDGDAYVSLLDDTDNKLIWVSKLHLLKLGDALFFDAESGDVSYSKTTKVSSPVLKAHGIGRIWIEKDALRIEMLSDDWLRDSAKNGAPELSFVEPDKQLIVTATTKQLQVFALKYANDAKVFSEELKFTRHK
jgi:hypothetical protein